MNNNSKQVSPLMVVGTAFGIVIAFWLIVLVIDWVQARATPQAGQIGVIRSGSDPVWAGAWFNGHGIRGVVKPGSGSTYVGLGSTVHYYPADSVQRQYTITALKGEGDRPGVDYVQVPTKDGIQVALEGSFYFTTNFDASSAGQANVKGFDNRFGVRAFPVAGTTKELYPYQGTDGWEAFLDTVVRPIIDNDLRKAISSTSCAQLVSSCALVHEQTQAALSGNGSGNNQAIQAIQSQINSSLQTDISETLGHDYFSNVQFLLAKAALPSKVQDQIDQAQAQFAAVGTAKAQVQQANLQAQANRERETGYRGCPACAQIDELKAIPSNVTTFAPGSNFAVTPK